MKYYIKKTENTDTYLTLELGEWTPGWGGISPVLVIPNNSETIKALTLPLCSI